MAGDWLQALEPMFMTAKNIVLVKKKKPTTWGEGVLLSVRWFSYFYFARIQVFNMY